MNKYERGAIGDSLYWLARAQVECSYGSKQKQMKLAIENLEEISQKYDEKIPRKKNK